jgi:eukaryotic-like serine/threonine-protein kinase
MSGDLAPGVVIAGRYRLDRMLGQGGMGVVWAATHLITRRAVAMKFLRGPLHDRPELRRRFQREARAASAVQHPNVVEIQDVFELDDDTPVMVMDLLVGETLAQRLEAQRRLTVEQMASVLLPVVSAVGTAHARGIVHRDLKPENIFLAETDEGRTEVKVLDFGIAKLSEGDADAIVQSALTGAGSLLGTPSYSAPEQLFGETQVDHRADLWALGVVMYECLSGELPVYGENLGQVLKMLTSGHIAPLESLVPTLPADITELVGRMMSRAVESRPADLREVLGILQRYSQVPVRSFGAAALQPAVVDTGPGVVNRPRPPTSSQDQVTFAATTPSGKVPERTDTAASYAMSNPTAPGARRRLAVVAAGALITLGVGLGGWMIGRSRGSATTALPAEPSSPSVASPGPSSSSIVNVHEEAAPRASSEKPDRAEPENVASKATSDKTSGKVPVAARPASSKASASSKGDPGAKTPEPGTSKGATPRRPGGLIEDVPF